ncbi:MAG: ATPase-like protein, partial [Acidimicrobiales bacterium]|nr:ATPase-like protein [Acidimicrobiales bacterium]
AGARALLALAVAGYREAGAPADGARARRKLDDAEGARRRKRSGHAVMGWASLTGHERRIALLVAEGLTNAQVGQRVFLSRHTVDFHLRQIFRKLDIHSRIELAGRALGQRRE